MRRSRMPWPRRPLTPERVSARWLAALTLVAIACGVALSVSGAAAAATAVRSGAVGVALVILGASVVRGLRGGESRPVSRTTAAAGTVCAGAAFVLRRERSAADSTYSSLVRLVENAHAAPAPFDRTVVIDRTGTLTLGEPEVARVVPVDGL